MFKKFFVKFGGLYLARWKNQHCLLNLNLQLKSFSKIFLSNEIILRFIVAGLDRKTGSEKKWEIFKKWNDYELTTKILLSLGSRSPLSQKNPIQLPEQFSRIFRDQG